MRRQARRTRVFRTVLIEIFGHPADRLRLSPDGVLPIEGDPYHGGAIRRDGGEERAFFDNEVDYYESAEIIEGKASVTVEVEGQYNGPAHPERIFWVHQIDHGE